MVLVNGTDMHQELLFATSDVAEAVGTTKNAAQVKLNALQRSGKVVKLGDGRWAAAHIEPPETPTPADAGRTAWPGEPGGE